MAKLPSWADWEADIQKLFGLDTTICSGNQWNDVGDAVDNDHASPWPIMADGKFTDTKASWSLKAKDVARWFDTATEKGKRGIMAIRIWTRGQYSPEDFVVCSADDYAELVEYYREGHKPAEPGMIVFPPGVRTVTFRGHQVTLHTEDPTR